MKSSQKSFKNLRKTFSDLKRSGIEDISEDPVLCLSDKISLTSKTYVWAPEDVRKLIH